MAASTNNPNTNNTNTGTATNRSSTSSVIHIGNTRSTEQDLLRSIDHSLQQLLRNSSSVSQSNARSTVSNTRSIQNMLSNVYTNRSNRGVSSFRRSSSMSYDPTSFLDGLERSLMNGLGTSDFRDRINDMLHNFCDLLGTDLEHAPNIVGQELGRHLSQSFRNTSIGQSLTNSFQNLQNRAINSLNNTYNQGVQNYLNRNGISNFNGPFTPEAIRNAINGQNNQNTQSNPSPASTPSGQSQSSTSQLIQQGIQSVVNPSSSGPVSSLISNTSNPASIPATTPNVSVPASSAASAVATSNPASSAMAAASGGATEAGAALSGLASVAQKGSLVILAVSLALAALEPAITGVTKFFKVFSAVGDRANTSKAKNQELAKKRLQDDVETIIKKPFEMLAEAAQAAYDAWDTNLRKINGTQGYTKSDLQDLMASYADRLRSEGLTRVVSSTDIVNNLSKVLDSGLSGVVAEEFAYLATKLNAAVPTQDFFSYGDVYASLAANAIKQGKSQSEAIEYANQELETFASNVLYSSRQLAGGFTTGLKDAESLFEKSVQIAQTSKTEDAAQIAGVLTSVSAITGAIAPDLASSIIDAVVKAATGGNSSEIVALRSLAGINASNTEFLQQLANDPQKVFSELFRNLASMQNMSQSAYMEVAEGLSSTFGISMDALSRVDFNYLAENIEKMTISTASLEENMQQLQSGETTTNAEQMKMAQINEYILNEGLSYVLDNEAARAIQQHMWDEQIARELQEATYGIEIQGAALELLESLKSTVDNILSFINPFSWLSKLVNAISSAQEASAQQADINQLLELGKVGKGNISSIYQLTTRNADLDLAPGGLVGMMGGISSYKLAASQTKFYNSLANPLSSNSNSSALNKFYKGLVTQNATDALLSFSGSRSSYTWGTLSKSAAKMIASTDFSNNATMHKAVQTVSDTTKAQSNISSKLDEFISTDTMKSVYDSGKTYQDYIASASRYGIADLEEALSNNGYTMSQLEQQWQTLQTEDAAEKQRDRLTQEETFWNLSELYQSTIMTDQKTMISLTETQIGILTTSRDYQKNILDTQLNQLDVEKSSNEHIFKILTTTTQFYNEWISYYVKHTAYNAAYKSSDVLRIQNMENDSSGEKVNKLAETLTSSVTNLQDPTVQTNVLLSQILIALNTIVQQNGSSTGTGGLSLPDTLQALALGMVKTT